MSESSEKGKQLENQVATLLRKKLGARVTRDGKSGAGTHQKMDITNYFGDIPLAIEVKNHATLKPREWWKQATSSASIGQVPTVVFNVDEEPLALLRFSDLVDLLVEIKDANKTITDLRTPILTPGFPIFIEKASAGAVANGAKSCRNGHLLSSGMTQCFAKGCPYSAGYRAKKVKK